MTCRDACGFLDEYLAGELPSALLADFEGHTAGCVNCQAFLTQYRRAIDCGQQACQDPASDACADIPEELVKAILDSLAKA